MKRIKTTMSEIILDDELISDFEFEKRLYLAGLESSLHYYFGRNIPVFSEVF